MQPCPYAMPSSNTTPGPFTVHMSTQPQSALSSLIGSNPNNSHISAVFTYISRFSQQKRIHLNISVVSVPDAPILTTDIKCAA